MKRMSIRRWLVLLVCVALVALLVLRERPSSDVPVDDAAEPREESTEPLLRGSPKPAPGPERVPERPEPGPIPPFRLRVVTVDGEPVEGARVSRVLGVGAHTVLGTTDAAGALEVVIEPAGVLATQFLVEKRGFVRQGISADRNKLNELRLERGAAVEGQVLEMGSDTPVAGATVRVFTGKERERVDTTTSDAHGRFAFGALPPRRALLLVARVEGLHAVAIKRTFPSDEPVVLRLGGRGTLEGHVFDPDGSPAAGLKVWLMRPDRAVPPRQFPRQYVFHGAELIEFFYPCLSTDDRGYYVFRGIELKQPRVPVAWLSERAEVAGEVVTFTENGQTITRDIRLPALGAVSYRVLGEAGQALGAEVQVDFTSPRVWFDGRRASSRSKPAEDGWFTIEGLVPGPWKLRAWIPASGAVEQTIEVVAGETTRVTLAGPRGGAIEGTVVDTTGKPVHGAAVSWWDGKTSRRGETDAAGRFRLGSVPDTAGRLEVESRGFAWRGPPLAPEALDEVRPGGEPLRIVLYPAGRVTGRLHGVESAQSFQVGVYSRRVTGSGHHETGADGTFALTAPYPGVPFLLKIERPGFAPRFVESAALKRGQDLDLGTLSFDQGVELTGVVQDEAGEGIAGARVRMTERWLDQSVRATEDGGFRFTRLPERPIWMRVDAKGYPAHFFIVETRAPVTAKTLRLSSGGRLKGEILGPEGKLLADGTLSVVWDVTHRLDEDLDHLRMSYRLASGRLDLELQPGTYRLRAWNEGYERSADKRVEIREGEVTDLNMQLAR